MKLDGGSVTCVCSRLAESPYTVVLEQLLGLDPAQGKLSEEEEEEEEVLQRPLQICLENSTVSVPDGTSCPVVRPQAGVAALHQYSEWITELNAKRGGADCEYEPLRSEPARPAV